MRSKMAFWSASRFESINVAVHRFAPKFGAFSGLRLVIGRQALAQKFGLEPVFLKMRSSCPAASAVWSLQSGRLAFAGQRLIKLRASLLVQLTGFELIKFL